METRVLVVLLVIFSAVTVHSRKREQFKVIYEWNTFDFNWPSNESRKEAIASGKYIKENVIISGIRSYGDKLYITLPRLKTGVPATLAWIPLTPQLNDTSPLLVPFPSWNRNEIGDCSGFQSVQSIEVDKSGMMWIIDNGRTSTINPQNSTAHTCPPSLSLINLNDTQHSFVRYTFPESVASNISYLNDIVVDDSEEGYAYISDNSRMDPGIIVFNRKDSRSWKIREANSMTAAQNAKHFMLNGTQIDLPVNIDGIALGPRYLGPHGLVDRNVYYCPLASYHLYSIPTSVLKNSSIVTQPAQLTLHLVSDMGVKPSQSDGMIMDEEGFLFYGLLGNYSIAQWDSRLDFATNQVIISKDKMYIQWADRFGFDEQGGLFVVVNRLHNFVAGKINPDEVNYRILKSNVGTRSYIHGPTANLFKDPPKTKVVVNHPVKAKSTSGASKPDYLAAIVLFAFMSVLFN